MPVEPHARARRSTARAATPGPWPRPPTAGALIKPDSPAPAIASIAARGEVPSRSTAAACSAAGPSAIASSFFRISDSSWTIFRSGVERLHRRRPPGPGGQRRRQLIRPQGLNPSGRCVGQVLVSAIHIPGEFTSPEPLVGEDDQLPLDVVVQGVQAIAVEAEDLSDGIARHGAE